MRINRKFRITTPSTTSTALLSREAKYDRVFKESAPKRDKAGPPPGRAPAACVLLIDVHVGEGVVQADGRGHQVVHVGSGQRGVLDLEQVAVGHLVDQDLLQLGVGRGALLVGGGGGRLVPQRVGFGVPV